ncbi:hypothetical protein ETAA8_60820 [Anatilimnocola aggregata]|uniref:Uncharacterized protein n=1 Tax=Anatilimnocola aggregata TaxID=2528021 RepID=A0A517YL23_9BACT|nr:hypothetical protein [Anatilimnocola aggregata]QDU30929.1 hypothetical protein ETAA8_60820 [Anatilimnocola aggregata]
MKLVALSVLIWLAFGCAGGTASAHTSTANPEELLETLPVGEGPALRAQAQARLTRAGTLLAAAENKIASGSMTRATIVDVANAASEFSLLGHAAERLTVIGEAAGSDLQQRLIAMATRIKAAARQAQQNPDFRAEILQQELDAIVRAQEVRFPFYRKQIEAGNRVAIESTLIQLLSEVHRRAVFLETETGRFYQPFRKLLNEFQPALHAARWQEHSAAVQSFAAPPRLDKVAEALNKCAQDLQTGPCLWNGKECTALELIDCLAEDLRRLQLAALRTRGWQLAAIPPDLAAEPQTPAIEGNHAELMAQVEPLVLNIVKLSASRATPEAAEAEYRAWLTTLSKLGIGQWDEKTIDSFQAALEPLVNRSREMQKQVAHYREATDDYLRWRQRLTLSQAAKLHKTCPPLINAITPVARAHDGKLYLIGERSSLEVASVLSSIADVCREFNAKLVDQPVSAPRVFAPPGSNWGASRYEGRVHASVPLPLAPELAQQTSRLRERLLCPPGAQPLSLRGSLCLLAAETGYYQHVGGKIREIRVLPLSLGYVHFWDHQAGLAPCSRLPKEPVHLKLHNHVMLDVRLEPTWIQHEAFLISLTATAPSP